tara:strand:+ start:1940 stop:2293 length:354 start_codon:yes stop_codon:yes gene_type:complete
MGFRSGLEEQVAESLDTLGVIYEYESTRISYTLQCKYSPDFILANGVHLEAKGYFPGKERRKLLAVIKDNPDLDVRMVFQKPYQKLYKGSKTTYAQWCDKHNIKWCSYYDIPIEWLT